jgi:ferredoxin
MTFWVKERCIDCGTCWQWDPQHFAPAPNTFCRVTTRRISTPPGA